MSFTTTSKKININILSKKTRVLYYFSFVFGLSAGIILFIDYYLTRYSIYTFSESTYVLLLTSTVFLSFMFFSYAFLREEEKTKTVDTNINEKYKDSIKDELKQIYDKIKYFNTDKEISENEKKEIKDRVVASLTEVTVSNIFKQESYLLEKKIGSELEKKYFKDSFDSMTDRLKSEITLINKRSMYNLLIGVSITLLGVGILSDSIVNLKNNIPAELIRQSIEKTNIKVVPTKLTINVTNKFLTTDNVISLIPTFSLVLFIELFAYFFLRLYREGLSEMKYFQNELTNIESKLIAVEIALIQDNKKILKIALESLLATERNFIMKKGETTVELERAKSESESVKSIIKAVPNLFKNNGK